MSLSFLIALAANSVERRSGFGYKGPDSQAYRQSPESCTVRRGGVRRLASSPDRPSPLRHGPVDGGDRGGGTRWVRRLVERGQDRVVAADRSRTRRLEPREAGLRPIVDRVEQPGRPFRGVA